MLFDTADAQERLVVLSAQLERILLHQVALLCVDFWPDVVESGKSVNTYLCVIVCVDMHAFLYTCLIRI